MIRSASTHQRKWERMPGSSQTCNKQTVFVLFFVKLFVHSAGLFRGSSVSVGHWREALAYSHFPHGSGQPLQGRMSAGGNQPPDRRHHFRREYGVFRAREKISRRLRTAQRTDVRDRFPHGGGAESKPAGHRKERYPRAAGA